MSFQTHCQQASLKSVAKMGSLKAPTYKSAFLWRNSAEKLHHERADHLLSFLFDSNQSTWLGMLSISSIEQYIPNEISNEQNTNIYLNDGIHRLAVIHMAAKVVLEIGRKIIKEEIYKGTNANELSALNQVLGDELLCGLSSLNLECKVSSEEDVVSLGHYIDRLNASLFMAAASVKFNHSRTEATNTEIDSFNQKNDEVSLHERIAQDEMAQIYENSVYVAYLELRERFYFRCRKDFFSMATYFVQRLHSMTLGWIVTHPTGSLRTSRRELESHIQASHFLK